MYVPRTTAALSPAARTLASDGIFAVEDIYSVNEIAALNASMGRVFEERKHLPRSYVLPDDILALGILNKILTPKMRELILAIMPDPVLYHFHAYEIAGNSTKSHIFSESLGGWHRDPDSEYFESDPTHLSVFVYLSDVAGEDGPFEFSLQQPSRTLTTNSPAVSMTGPTGYSFIWHRSFYHRAAPNRGPRRRRLIKISVQRNCFASSHLSNPHFQKLIKNTPPGDEFIDLLLGRYQGKAAPEFKPSTEAVPERIQATSTINLPDDVLAKLRKQEEKAKLEPVAYD
jgi:hypothetical protein